MKENRDTPYAAVEATFANLDRFHGEFTPQLFDSNFWKQAQEMNLIKRPLVEQMRLLELVHVEDTNQLAVDVDKPDWALFNLTIGEYV